MIMKRVSIAEIIILQKSRVPKGLLIINIRNISNLHEDETGMNKRHLNIPLHHYKYSNSLSIKGRRKYATKPKITVKLEETISKDLEEMKIKPRHHPGVMKNKNVPVPPTIVKAIEATLKDHPAKAIAMEGAALSRYLKCRHPPPEESYLLDKMKDIEDMVEHHAGVDYSTLGDEEREHVRKLNRGKVMHIFKQKVYSWKAIPYDEYRALHYLVGRSAQEYAVLVRILSELKNRNPDFSPRSFFDFGSGVGTGTWAARHLWQKSLYEYFCVDSSADMNDLAALVLRDGNEQKELTVKGLMYRQFLPAANNLTYDIVLSAYSLFELPSAHSRLETLLNLWSKTEQYLVLVEHGSNAGFKIINEARDFLLQHNAHIFAPCPHSLACPRFLSDNTPCNFEVTYTTLPIAANCEIKRELFSYVVLSKVPLTNEPNPRWPRIVRPTLVRSKHTVCRLCTPEGDLKEVIFTASKHGKIPYRCARASNWGDLLPVTLSETGAESMDDNSAETVTESMDDDRTNSKG